jgi:cell division initiation protein
MRITPLEIRQKSFEKKMRGYDKDTVDAFILSLSHEWERQLDEMKYLKQQLETSQQDVKKLREVEESLFKTLKTAEDTGSNLIDQANKNAELTIKEAQMNAEAMLTEARSQVKDMLDQADGHVKEVLGGLDDEARRIEGDLRIAENHRDSLLRELSMLANDTLARVANLSSERVEVIVPKKEIVKPIPPVAKYLANEITDSINAEEAKEEFVQEVIEESNVDIVETKEKQSGIGSEISFEVNTSFDEPQIKEPKQEAASEDKPSEAKKRGSFFDHLD